MGSMSWLMRHFSMGILMLGICCGAVAFIFRTPAQCAAYSLVAYPIISRSAQLHSRRGIRHDIALTPSSRCIHRMRMILTSHETASFVTIDSGDATTKTLELEAEDYSGDVFQLLIEQAVQTLVKSDTDGEELDHSYGSASQGLWLHAPQAKKVQQILDKVALKMHQDLSIDSTLSLEEEKCHQWVRWMKTTPSPLFLDFTTHVHKIIVENHQTNNAWLTDEHLDFIDMNLDQYISRIACHMILLPSGQTTPPLSLVESTGAHIYGKLMYGGVTRFRLLKSGMRAGERTHQQSQRQYCHPSWVQLGGLERKYEAVDMGPAAVFEITLLPRLWQDLPTIFDKSVLMGSASMTISDSAFGWDPSILLRLLPDSFEDSDSAAESSQASAFEHHLEVSQRGYALMSHLQSRVGGLQQPIEAIVRRVLDGRNIYPELLGLQPVRGLLLYGRPGVGKTLLVREIAGLISTRPPKIVAGSELLDRWIGGSERLVRELFQDAEDELRMCQMAATTTSEKEKAYLNSALHIIVIDEIDAVFRNRVVSNDSGSITRNSVVNQLLAKLDGVHQLPNILMIGMTNRRELLDPALLRPGRLEVQIEIPLPGQSQRREILKIHFGALRRRNRLSYPLRCAIDGVASNWEKTLAEDHSYRRERRALKVYDLISTGRSVYDLADETEGFSGADIEGLVRCSGSIALSRARTAGAGVEALLITLDDVKQALTEVKL